MQRTLISLLMSLTLVPPVLAESVKVEDAWVRATAPGQKVAGGFMKLTADADMTLTGGESAVSKAFELHTMSMDNGVMVMRQVNEIVLPKDKTVSLEPGGLHVMFIGLKRQIKPGEKVPVTLNVKGRDGKMQVLKVDAMAHAPGGGHHHH